VLVLAVALGGSPADARPLSAAGPLHLVYDVADQARLLYQGRAGLPGLRSTRRSVRQHPPGEPFPPTRRVAKVSHRDLARLGFRSIAAVLRSHLLPGAQDALPSGLVAIDEIGVEMQDDGAGPALERAMRLLARERFPATGEPLSRRVLLYAAPKMVANVGSGHERALWDAALAAARRSGGVYLQMYHAHAGRLTGPATATEWRRYLPVWARAVPGGRRLRVVLTNGGVPQARQWRWARQTPAGRAALRNGVGAYRLRSTADALAWLRHWNRFAR
jgi:hypothetical protein